MRRACQKLMLACAILLLNGAGVGAALAQEGRFLHKLPVLKAAPAMKLPDLDGARVDLADFSGKVVLVNFWATWCPPCRAEIPSMQRAWKQLQTQDVMLLAVHVGGNEDKIWTFLTDHNVDFPVLVDKGGKASRKWPLVGLPTSFLVGSDGKILSRAIGGREWDHPDLIKEILAARK